MIPAKETLTIEFKSDLKGLSDNELIETVIGMTNTNGGELYLGIEDDGSVTGIKEKHKDEIGVAALIANKTIPSVPVRAEIISEKNKNILKINIPKSRTVIASTDGKILRRRLKIDGSPENIPMYPYEITTRLSELKQLDYSSQIIQEATIDDFDPNERIRLRNIIKQRKGDRSLLELSDEELDKALCFVKGVNNLLFPTITGLLLIGKEERIQELLPTAKSSFQVLEGNQVRINEQYSKPLLATFEIFENFFNAWNSEKEIDNGMIRIPIPEFSKAAFREGLVNAFCHRDYSILQMVRLIIEDDGMSISSPGGFVEGVNLYNLLTVEPQGRNPILADVLKRIGLAERTGRGIDRIYEGSIVYGRPLPDYSESTESYVKLFVPRAKPDLSFIRMITEEENHTGRMLPINSLLILSMLQKNGRTSLKELADSIHISEARIKTNIEKLIENGLVTTSESRKCCYYFLNTKVYKKESSVSNHSKQSVISLKEHEKKILKLAKNQNYITRENLVELIGVNENQAYRILKKLTEQNKLELIGKGRNSKYIIKASRNKL